MRAARAHRHGDGCGHLPVRHGAHVDYLREGRLEHAEGDRLVEHVLPVDEQNPASCTPRHRCAGHDGEHLHGPGCGHAAVPHGDHVDYLVGGHLHRPHLGHCDDHGPLLPG